MKKLYKVKTECNERYYVLAETIDEVIEYINGVLTRKGGSDEIVSISIVNDYAGIVGENL